MAMAPDEAAQEQPTMDMQGKDPTQDQQDPMKAVSSLGESMNGLAQAMAQAGAPKEVLAPLQDAIKSFGMFMDALQGKGAQPMAANTMNEAGNPNAAPAGY